MPTVANRDPRKLSRVEEFDILNPFLANLSFTRSLRIDYFMIKGLFMLFNRIIAFWVKIMGNSTVQRVFIRANVVSCGVIAKIKDQAIFLCRKYTRSSTDHLSEQCRRFRWASHDNTINFGFIKPLSQNLAIGQNAILLILKVRKSLTPYFLIHSPINGT